MSVANIHISTDRVWLISDTLQFDLDGEPHSFASKFSVYAHIYALAGFRGLAQIHHRLDAWMNGLGCVLDVEDAAARLPERLRFWRGELIERHPDHEASIVGQIWLAGWRPSKKAFGGWRFNSTDDFALVALEVPSTHVNPGNDHAPPPATLVSPDMLVRLVEAQREMSAMNIAAGGADMGIGGEVVLVELTRQGFTIRKAYRFSDYAEVKEMLRNAR